MVLKMNYSQYDHNPCCPVQNNLGMLVPERQNHSGFKSRKRRRIGSADTEPTKSVYYVQFLFLCSAFITINLS